MKKFLFSFGFETPDEERVNNETGSDYESSCSLYIVAENEKQAISWGKEVSENLLHFLYAKKNREYSWEKHNFSFGIEKEPEKNHPPLYLKALKVIHFGKYEDFDVEQYRLNITAIANKERGYDVAAKKRENRHQRWFFEKINRMLGKF